MRRSTRPSPVHDDRAVFHDPADAGDYRVDVLQLAAAVVGGEGVFEPRLLDQVRVAVLIKEPRQPGVAFQTVGRSRKAHEALPYQGPCHSRTRDRAFRLMQMPSHVCEEHSEACPGAHAREAEERAREGRAGRANGDLIHRYVDRDSGLEALLDAITANITPAAT